MKKKIEEALRTEFAGLGLSDNTIGRLADYLKGSVEKEEDIATAVTRDDVKLIAKSIQGEIDGLKRAKETAEKALEEYKAKNPQGGDDPSKQKTDPQPDLAKTIADAISAAIAPLNAQIEALKTSNSAKEALASAKESFFSGDYAKKYKDQAEDAWERAVEMNEATGSKMTAEELNAKATGYFNKSVSRLGVDTSKPFKADPTQEDEEGTMDWSAERKRLQESGKIAKD